MFTGIIEGMGHLAKKEEKNGDARLRVNFQGFHWKDICLGESIAINGTCLTVTEYDDYGFWADASRHTLECTTLGRLVEGSVVNLERAMRSDSRFGGHMVSGHVDGVGKVSSITQDARAQRWSFALPKTLLRYVAQKGSVCIDGVSLTVNALDAHGCEVALIPHTLTHTAFSHLTVGDSVNVEVDILARYIQRLLETQDKP